LNIRTSSGFGPRVDDACRTHTEVLSGLFELRPHLMFCDESGPANAWASPNGTIIIGSKLINRYKDRKPFAIGSPRYPAIGFSLALVIIVAHEFGHLLQFKKGVTDSGAMELHADFMAGWADTAMECLTSTDSAATS
jgi:hypothetical protein